MEYIYYSILTWLIFMLCGLPFMFLPMPSFLAKYRLFFAPTFGYSYMIFVSYHLYRFNLPGTDSYAFPVLIFPLLVSAGLFLYYNRRNPQILQSRLASGRESMICGAHALISFVIISIPAYVIANGGALAISMGNLDLANYAIGSRALQEFSRLDPTGFLGQTGECLSQNDNFWFGPSAIAANVSTLLSSKPYKIQGLVMAIAASQGAGIIYIYLVENLRVRQMRAHIITFLCASSPIFLFTVWESFGGQIVSMPLLILLILIATTWVDDQKTSQYYKRYIPVFVLTASGILATYHYSLLIVTALVLAAQCIRAILDRSIKKAAWSLCLYAISMALTMALDPLRVKSLILSLQTVGGAAAGWFIPWVSPSLIIGANGGSLLIGGVPVIFSAYFIYAISILIGILSVYALYKFRRERSMHVFYFGIFLPVMAMSLLFALRDYHGDALGGYRSYKISSLFMPFLIIGILIFLKRDLFQNKYANIVFSAFCFLFVAYSSLVSNASMVRHMRNYAYTDHREMGKLQNLENFAFIKGINIPAGDNNTLMWINYFTLRAPQVYQIFPYGGRVVANFNPNYHILIHDSTNKKVTSGGDIFNVHYFDSENILRVGGGFDLLKASGSLVTIDPAKGWWGSEGTHRWSGSDGTCASIIAKATGDGTPVRITARCGVLAVGDEITVYINDEPVAIRYENGNIESEKFSLAKGDNIIKMCNRIEPKKSNPADPRTLGVLWYDVTLFVLPK